VAGGPERPSAAAGSALSSAIKGALNAELTANGRSIPQIGPDIVTIGCIYGGLFIPAESIRARVRQKGTQMNATLPETTESNPETDSNLAAVSEVEAGIRDFVRNDVAYLRRPGASFSNSDAPADSSAEATVNSVNSLIQRVAGTSLAEIERLITELEGLRDLLHAEGQRVQREISGYAQLSQAAMKSTRIISENVAQWKKAAENLRHD